MAPVWRDNKGVSLSVLSAAAGRGALPGSPAFTDNGSCRCSACKAVARAWELGCETSAPLPGRNGYDETVRKRSFSATAISPTNVKVKVRRVKDVNEVRRVKAVDTVVDEW